MSQNENMGFYDDLQTHRVNAGLSKNKLAALATVSVDSVTKAEKHQPCQRTVLAKLANALGKSPEQVITSKSRFG